MALSSSRLTRLVKGFRGRTIGVMGDFMVDELLRGEATRISPEAPVPVVLMRDPAAAEGFPGGAGNVAANIRSLGGRPIVFGAIGDDAVGRQLCELLRRRGIPSATLVRERGRLTPRKIRIVAHQQQLVRLDIEHPALASPGTVRRLAAQIARNARRINALIISDYNKGTVTTELVQEATSLCRQKRIPIFVDPKPEHREICRHATVATPNLKEAETMVGRSLRTRPDLLAGGRRLLAELGCAHLLVTRGGEGMTLFSSDGSIHDIPGHPRPVFDVTGAGDTVLAVLALACSAGASLPEAAELANRAGGRVVLKFGTAEVTAQELIAALSDQT